VPGLGGEDLHHRDARVRVGQPRQRRHVGEDRLLLARDARRQVDGAVGAGPWRGDPGERREALEMARVLAHQQLRHGRADHRRAGRGLDVEQAAQHLGVGRRRGARLVHPAAAEQQRRRHAEEAPAREAYHQTVESRFSISSTGRV
jgi:hypothetical protein